MAHPMIADAQKKLEEHLTVFSNKIEEYEVAITVERERLVKAMEREVEYKNTIAKLTDDNAQLRKQLGTMEEHPDVKARKLEQARMEAEAAVERYNRMRGQ